MDWFLFKFLRLKKMPIVFMRRGYGFGLTRYGFSVSTVDRGVGVGWCWRVYIGRRSWRVSPRFMEHPEFLEEHLTPKEF